MKRLFSNLLSGSKALQIQAIVLALFVVLILATLCGLLIQKGAADDIYNRGLRGIQSSGQLLTDLSRVHGNLYRIQAGVSLSQDTQEVSDISEQQATIMASDVELVKRMLASGLLPKEKQLYEQIQENLLEYQRVTLKSIKLAPLGTGVAYLAAADEKLQIMNQLLTELLTFQSKYGKEAYEANNRNFYIILAFLFILFAAAVVLSFVIKNYMTHDALSPIQAPVEEHPTSLSGMVGKGSEQKKEADRLITSSKDAMDKLRGI